MPETKEKPLDLAAVAEPLGRLRERIKEAREFFPHGSGLNHLPSALEDLERNGAVLKPMEIVRRLNRVERDVLEVLGDLISSLTRDPTAHYHLKIDEQRLRVLRDIGDACAELARQLPNDPKGAMNRAAKAFNEKIKVGEDEYRSVRHAWSTFGTAFAKIGEWVANHEQLAELSEAK